LANQDGNSLQPLGRDVARPSPIPTDKSSWQNSKEVLVLMSILNGITSHLYSSDAFELSLMQARETCRELNISDETVEEVFARFREFRRDRLKQNPISKMF